MIALHRAVRLIKLDAPAIVAGKLPDKRVLAATFYYPFAETETLKLIRRHKGAGDHIDAASAAFIPEEAVLAAAVDGNRTGGDSLCIKKLAESHSGV